MSKPVVLFLAASPQGTAQLALAEECAAITRELKMSPGRNTLDFQARWAVTLDDLMRELNELEPALIHFSGHGNAQGIALVGPTGAVQLVTPAALAGLVASTGKSARAVVLNACYSDAQAAVLTEQLGCAIGMRGTIPDDAALEFSVAFYRAIGHARSVHEAFLQAVATLAAKGLDRRADAHCLTRADIDANAIALLSAPNAPEPVSPTPIGATVVNSAGRDNTAIHAGDIRLGDHGNLSIGIPGRK